MKWGPRKPRTSIKIVECGQGHWDEKDHGLDIPHGLDTTDFRVTGTGHERIEQILRLLFGAVAHQALPESAAGAAYRCLDLPSRLFIRAVRHEGEGDGDWFRAAG